MTMVLVTVTMATLRLMEDLVHSAVLGTLVVATLDWLSMEGENRVREKPILR